MKDKGEPMNGSDAVEALDKITVRAPRTHEPATTERSVRAVLDFSEEQLKMIRDTFANGANKSEFEVLMEVAKSRGLNPILGQIHFIKRWGQGGDKWSCQVAIDGFRAIAERTGKYDGQDEPEFVYAEDGKSLVLARVRVYRKDQSRPSVGVAYFAEYAQFTKDGKLTKMWKEKPHIMLAKCAESIAIRKGFPQDTSGLYTPEEMGHDEAQNQKLSIQPMLDAIEETDDEKISRWTDAVTAAKTLKELIAVAKESRTEPMSETVKFTVSKEYAIKKAELERAEIDAAPVSDDAPLDVEPGIDG